MWWIPQKRYVQSLEAAQKRGQGKHYEGDATSAVMWRTTECPLWSFPGDAAAKNLPAKAGISGDRGSIPGPGRSPGGGNGNPLQYSCLEDCCLEEPGGLQSEGSQRIWHDWTLIHAMESIDKNVKLKAPSVWDPYGEKNECNGSSFGDGEERTE